jgi:predicted SAM-dependent methyltransferase
MEKEKREIRLNLACGNRIHPAWHNLDFSPASKLVKKANLLGRLPYDNETVNYIYTSHFLEHVPQNKSFSFLTECARIIRKDGILRIVVPDLENICREYIRIIDSEPHSFKREWIVVELLDQMVRNQSGGEMQNIYNSILSSDDDCYKQYVYERVGEKIEKIEPHIHKREVTFDKIKNKMLKIYLFMISKLIPKDIRELIFVQTSIGEKHLWMYDRYQLIEILKKVGFSSINFKTYNDSEIPDFNSYLLDINEDGSPYKGVSSLYCECKK